MSDTIDRLSGLPSAARVRVVLAQRGDELFRLNPDGTPRWLEWNAAQQVWGEWFTRLDQTGRREWCTYGSNEQHGEAVAFGHNLVLVVMDDGRVLTVQPKHLRAEAP
jgi:hypothetical protein